jgi:hypothetical protein
LLVQCLDNSIPENYRGRATPHHLASPVELALSVSQKEADMRIFPTRVTAAVCLTVVLAAGMAVAQMDNSESIKEPVRSSIMDLLAADKISSSATSDAGNLIQFVGQGVTLGDLYTAFEMAKSAADNGSSRLLAINFRKEFSENILKSLQEAKEAFQIAAILRGQIAKEVMEWLDTRKPSLEASFQKKAHQVTVCITQAMISLTGAMSAAGYTLDEINAELGDISGKGANPQQESTPLPAVPKKKKK